MKKIVAVAAATALLGLGACSKPEEANTAATENVVENVSSENVVDLTNETANVTEDANATDANATDANATDANATEAAK
jgi:hypothetical protein